MHTNYRRSKDHRQVTRERDLFKVLGTRTLHVVDLENLLSGWMTVDRVSEGIQCYLREMDCRQQDRVLIGMAAMHEAKASVVHAGPWELVLGSNERDGADEALQRAIDISTVAAGFGRVVIASADHFFEPVAMEFRRRGLPVVNAVGEGVRTAKALRSACTRTTVLSEPTFRFVNPRFRLASPAA